MRAVRAVAATLSTALVIGGAALVAPLPAAADGVTPVAVTCSGIPLVGDQQGTVDVNATDDVDPVAPGGTVVNTLTVPVPIQDVPIEATITQVKLTIPIPTGVTINSVAFSSSSFSGQSWTTSDGNLVATLTGSVKIGGSAPAPTVPDVRVTTTVAGPPRTVQWKVPSLITARASWALGTINATCTPDAPATVLLTTTVANPNTAPTATAGTVAAISGRSVPVTLVGSDVDGDALTYTVTGAPTHGTLTGTAPNLTYRSNAGYSGADQVTFTVSDGAATAQATVAITVTGWWTPWSSGTAAVNDLYTWFTGVAPTSAQRTAALASLNAGTTTVGDLVAALRRGSDATANVDPTTRLYAAYFVRIPDAGGLNSWIGKRRAGRKLDSISSSFAASSEFKNRYGNLSNLEFVKLVYRNVLGREGDAGGVASWTKKLNDGVRTRGSVMVGFSESNEYKTGQVHNVDAAVVFVHLLGRSPSLTERDAFATAARTGSLAAAVEGLLTNPALAARAH